MAKKPTYEELEQRVKDLEKEIAERKFAEESLKGNETKYRDIFKNAPVGIFQSTPSGRYITANKEFSRTLGFDKPEALIQTVSNISDLYVDPLDRDEMKRLLQEHGSISGYEIHVKDKVRGTSWMSIYVRAVRNETGGIELYDGFTVDVTDQKGAEEALRESEEFLRTIVENIPDMIFVKNAKDLRFVRFNKAGEELLGYSREELIGKNDYDFFPKEEADFFTKKDRGVLSSGKHLDIPEELIQTKNKGERILHTKKIPIINKEGMPQYLLGISEDITERKQAEEALRESDKKFRILFDESPHATAVTEPQNGRILDVNSKFCELTGYCKEESIGKTTTDMGLYSKKDRARLIQEMKDRGMVKGLELGCTTKRGTKLTGAIYARLLNISGTSYMLTMFVDITEQRRLEAQLQQSQKMEAIGTLAGGIAHDFNNILAVILGNTELVSFDVPNSDPAAKSLKAIHQASIRAKGMVKQLLAFSRKNDEKSRPFNMTPIIKESMKMLRSAIPTSVEFKQHLSGDLCNVLGDATQINQIVMNLVTNAAHAMSEEGGLLEVTLENIALQEEKSCFDWVLSPGKYVRLKVRDTGEGIAPAIIERIFEPYYTTKEVGKGTGMGLSVVHGIVKRHGGGIRVESEVEKGTIFEIYFPALENAAEEKKEPEGEIKGGSERILFVDDEESLVSLNQQSLERLGYNVKSTTKPMEALEWFRTDPDQFDVIITDMTMPQMTGDRLAAEVLKIRPHLSVIICTGYSERMSAKKAETLGVSKYIEKPIGLRNLASSIREVLDEPGLTIFE